MNIINISNPEIRILRLQSKIPTLLRDGFQNNVSKDFYQFECHSISYFIVLYAIGYFGKTREQDNRIDTLDVSEMIENTGLYFARLHINFRYVCLNDQFSSMKRTMK